jgi:hypothetical protein
MLPAPAARPPNIFGNHVNSWEILATPNAPILEKRKSGQTHSQLQRKKSTPLDSRKRRRQDTR